MDMVLLVGTRMSDNGTGVTDADGIDDRRRLLLKLVAVGAVTPSAVGNVTSTSSTDIYDGPVARSYESEPVSPDSVERVTTEDDPLSPDGDEGSMNSCLHRDVLASSGERARQFARLSDG